MSVDFRQRRPSEYLKILKRRKWLVILPVIAITAAVAWVVFRLPDIYESTTLIVVCEPVTTSCSVRSSASCSARISQYLQAIVRPSAGDDGDGRRDSCGGAPPEARRAGQIDHAREHVFGHRQIVHARSRGEHRQHVHRRPQRPAFQSGGMKRLE